LLACSGSTDEEYFCESYAQESMTNVYKQQIVRLNANEMCVVWPIDTSHCAQFAKPTLTPWLEGSMATKEVRGHMQAVRSSTQVVVDILPFVRNQGSQGNGVAKPTEQLQFVFRLNDKSLQLTPALQTQRAIEFVCKPWVKQKWWAIY
jgi:hypothetical protein